MYEECEIKTSNVKLKPVTPVPNVMDSISLTPFPKSFIKITMQLHTQFTNCPPFVKHQAACRPSVCLFVLNSETDRTSEVV